VAPSTAATVWTRLLSNAKASPTPYSGSGAGGSAGPPLRISTYARLADVSVAFRFSSPSLAVWQAAKAQAAATMASARPGSVGKGSVMIRG